jgi:hypothetical protein
VGEPPKVEELWRGGLLQVWQGRHFPYPLRYYHRHLFGPTYFPFQYLAKELLAGVPPCLLPSLSLLSPYPDPLLLQIPFSAEELLVEVPLYLLPVQYSILTISIQSGIQSSDYPCH